MPVTTQSLELADAPSATDVTSPLELDTIGIELEYPVAADDAEIPASFSTYSRGLRDEIEYRESIPAGDAQPGIMASDHTGAEIVSQRMDLHSTEPEVWYNAMIQWAQDLGYPFSPNGYGDTNFGLHMHMSSLPREKAEGLLEISQENWFRLFVCTSLSRTSADPWRHGGVSARDLRGERDFQTQYTVNDRGGDHYEWRLPEPMLPEHLSMVMHFLRTLEVDGVGAARDYAHDAVHSGDTRLTAVQQFRVLDNDLEWRAKAVTDDSRTDPEIAQEVIEILDSAA